MVITGRGVQRKEAKRHVSNVQRTETKENGMDSGIVTKFQMDTPLCSSVLYAHFTIYCIQGIPNEVKVSVVIKEETL